MFSRRLLLLYVDTAVLLFYLFFNCFIVPLLSRRKNEKTKKNIQNKVPPLVVVKFEKNKYIEI